ncbi:MAG: hypothetical protein CMA06_02085 [Euryarchaeota archaeon]|nr:hypothetical protein [Euryarchaeota archaeon]
MNVAQHAHWVANLVGGEHHGAKSLVILACAVGDRGTATDAGCAGPAHEVGRHRRHNVQRVRGKNGERVRLALDDAKRVRAPGHGVDAVLVREHIVLCGRNLQDGRRRGRRGRRRRRRSKQSIVRAHAACVVHKAHGKTALVRGKRGVPHAAVIAVGGRVLRSRPLRRAVAGAHNCQWRAFRQRKLVHKPRVDEHGVGAAVEHDHLIHNVYEHGLLKEEQRRRRRRRRQNGWQNLLGARGRLCEHHDGNDGANGHEAQRAKAGDAPGEPPTRFCILLLVHGPPAGREGGGHAMPLLVAKGACVLS